MQAVLTTAQAKLLREAAENGGEIYIGDWCDPAERKTAKSLVRAGMLSCGTPHGCDYHRVTTHGSQWLARAEQESGR
jgi:hypothetical protein